MLQFDDHSEIQQSPRISLNTSGNFIETIRKQGENRMRFRQYQASARRNSTHLLWLYIIAVIAVAVFTAAATAFLSSLYPSLKGGSQHRHT